jgi:hypothetical protein
MARKREEEKKLKKTRLLMLEVCYRNPVISLEANKFGLWIYVWNFKLSGFDVGKNKKKKID